MSAKNKKILNLIGIFIVIFTSSLTVVGATTYLYNSNEVGYTNSGVTGDNVQTAIDEIKTEVDDYIVLNNKLKKLEAYFPSFTSGGVTTNPFSGAGAMLGKNANTSSNLWVDFYYNGVARGSVTSVTSPSGLTISGNNTSGTKGQGTLNLKASTIRAKISDSSITDITFLPNVGTYNPGNTEGEISVATGTYTTVGSISLDPGTWFLTFGCYFSNNGTGYRRLYLGTGSNNSSNIGIQTKVEVPGQTNVSPNYLHGSYPIEVTGTQTVTYYLKAYQNSGSALTAQGRVYGIRIK